MKSNDIEKEQISKPKILILTNGPYYLINDMKAKVVDNLQNSRGNPCQQLAELHYAAVAPLSTNLFVMAHIV